MAQEEEKGLDGAASMDRQEGLGSNAQREASSTAREGKAGLMTTVIERWAGVVGGIMGMIFLWHLFSHQIGSNPISREWGIRKTG